VPPALEGDAGGEAGLARWLEAGSTASRRIADARPSRTAIAGLASHPALRFDLHQTARGFFLRRPRQLALRVDTSTPAG